MRTVDDYLALITAFHRPRPRFVATVAEHVRPFVAVAAALADMPRAFDLDEAVGAQLDKDGEWIGYTRFLTYPLPNAWFSLGSESRGLGKGRWHVPGDPPLGTVRLEDDIYRALLKAKVRLNQWDGLASTAGAIFDTFFANPKTYAFIQDKHDGTQRLGISGEIPPLQYLMLLANDYLPARPAGIESRTLVTSVNGAPLLGLGVQNRKIAGPGTGAWAATPGYLTEFGYADVGRPRPGPRPPEPPPRPRFGLGPATRLIAGLGRGYLSAA